MTNRPKGCWLLALAAVLAACLRAPGDRPEPGDINPRQIANSFMLIYYVIEGAPDVATLNKVQELLARWLSAAQAEMDRWQHEVEDSRRMLESRETAIAELKAKLGTASDPATRSVLEQKLRDAEEDRQATGAGNATAYQNYLIFRGRYMAVKIMVAALQKELNKRMQALDAGAVFGTWAGSYTDPDMAQPAAIGGPFRLAVKGAAVSGAYQDGSASIPVSGSYDAASGIVSGTGSDPECPAQWSGTLTRAPDAKVLNGNGAFSFTRKGSKGRGSGTWQTK